MTSPVAGWYPDPAGDPSVHRWWDGSQWTEYTQAVAPTPAPVAPEPEPIAPAPSADVPPPPSVEPSPPAPSGSDAVPPPPAGVGGGLGFGGITSELLDETYAEVGSGSRVVKQNSRMLKVTLGGPVLARQGSMVAYQGNIDFDHEGSGSVGKFAKKMLTGEGVPLMRCTGQGELFLAHRAAQVHILWLEGAGLSVNGANVLAFEPSLEWNIERIKGAAMVAGGVFNTRLSGHGWVAITTKGDPVVLKTDQPTFADPDAAVAWSSSLTTTLSSSMKAKALVGRGSGEAFQLSFSGNGVVIVQPDENAPMPTA